jgi:hypothetical protein
MKTGLVMQQVEYWIPAFARMTDFMTCFVAKHEARMINIRFVAMHRDESRMAFIGLVFGYDTLFDRV